MSTILVLAPIIAGSWPAYASLVTGVAVSMGYNILKGQSELNAEQRCSQSEECEIREDIAIESTQKIAVTMKDGDSLKFSGPKYELTFVKDPRGTCTCQVKCVKGVRATKAELKREAEKIINKVTQTYVYNKLKSELAQKGYNIVSDEASEDQNIKITVRKWK
ncbi:MAG TPA: DUF1257 domain-containing protein [Candidatus Wallbacteria bacterium]|nr:DUF1257 domain-containing protein [Candidatus Wallbacteria bacterium]